MERFDGAVRLRPAGPDQSDGLDSLAGDDGNDRLWGGGGTDLLNSVRGDDRLIGLGHDTLYGQSGDDRFRRRDGVSDLIIGGVGTDAAGIDFGLDRVNGIETFF